MTDTKKRLARKLEHAIKNPDPISTFDAETIIARHKELEAVYQTWLELHGIKEPTDDTRRT